MWQRKHRQYICKDSPSVAPSLTHFDYTCRHTHDDLRIAMCSNKNNNSVIEVLKSEIECGWSKASMNSGFHLIFTLFVGVALHFLM